MARSLLFARPGATRPDPMLPHESFPRREARRVLAHTSALVALALVSPAAASAQVPHAMSSVGDGAATGIALSNGELPQRRLRGDWEPVDLLLLGYDPSWEDSLKQVIRQTEPGVQIQILVPSDVRQEARDFRQWASTRCVSVLDAALDTPWVRDYGPVQLFEDGASLWQDYYYSDARSRDDAAPWALAEAHQVPIDVEDPELDGGALAGNGRGLCAITNYSLGLSRIDPSSPAALSQLVSRLGCRALAVVPALPGEPTGHVDVSVQFLGPHTVAIASMDPAQEPERSALLDHAAWLIATAAETLGTPLQIVRVPMWVDGEVFYTYVNGTRVGRRFFVPSYEAAGRPYEEEAYRVLAAALPRVRLTAVPADSMIPLGGALHCISLGLNLAPSGRARSCAKPRTKLARAKPSRSR